MLHVSEATVLPVSTTDLSNVSTGAGSYDEFTTIRWITAPFGMETRSIKGSVISSTSNLSQQPSFRILVDGSEVYYLNRVPGSYYADFSVTCSGGEHVEFQIKRDPDENSYHNDFYLQNVSIEWGISFADEEARDAAIVAKNAANSAKASADAAHSDAENAAARTWYNGNESAYWAYYGYARANSANSNSASAKNMLNGSSNGGKSLADTWNKANAANSNAWNARNSLANGVGNNGKSLTATYDKANAASGDADYICIILSTGCRGEPETEPVSTEVRSIVTQFLDAEENGDLTTMNSLLTGEALAEAQINVNRQQIQKEYFNIQLTEKIESSELA